MIDVEKLIREGKSEEDILKLLKGDIETANLKIDKEKEAKKIEALKKEQLKDAIAQAEAALQAVYDLTGGKITVYILNGKVQVLVDEKPDSRGRNVNSWKYGNSILNDILDIWS